MEKNKDCIDLAKNRDYYICEHASKLKYQSRQEFNKMEFRLYNRMSDQGISTLKKLNCSIFDLIGVKEPDQTKGLGYVLAKSPVAMGLFLRMLGRNELLYLLQQRWAVDCELIQCLGGNQALRADILIRFYDGLIPSKAIIIEAKSVRGTQNNAEATRQVLSYRDKFLQLQNFKAKDIILVTLTTALEYGLHNRQVLSITWQDIRNAFTSIVAKEPHDYERRIISDYITYVNNLQNTMNYFDVEILSIPAGDSIKAVQNTYIYECPVTGRYKSRGKMHPLYVAFRNRGQRGRITCLFKIQDILVMDIDDDETIQAVENTGKYPYFRERLEQYKQQNTKYIGGMKWVFVLDKDNSIALPFPVEYEDSIQGMSGIAFLSLAEVIQMPKAGEKVVKLKMKKDKTSPK